MGYRLTRIYTRSGDSGKTSMGGGQRVEKDSARMEAIGTVDELNSAVGIVLAHKISAAVRAPLTQVQNDLFDLGGELSVPGRNVVTSTWVQRLEYNIDELNKNLPPLKEFILPGGGQAASACHLARTICRRAERRIVTLSRQETNVPAAVLAYVNRLSDLLFVAARILARDEVGSEVLWQPGKGGEAQ